MGCDLIRAWQWSLIAVLSAHPADAPPPGGRHDGSPSGTKAVIVMFR